MNPITKVILKYAMNFGMYLSVFLDLLDMRKVYRHKKI